MKFNMCQYFGESREEPKGGPEGIHQGPRRPLGAAPLGHAGRPPGALVAPLVPPLAYIFPVMRKP